MYTIVLAIKSNTHHASDPHNNIERFLDIGLVSYQKFLDITQVAEFIIIAPATDLAILREQLEQRAPTWPWRFLDEAAIIPGYIPAGWAKQQLTKLAIAPFVTTDNYLIVDDDVFLTRAFHEADMYHNGKLILNHMDNPDFPFFAIWSARILGVDYDLVQDFPYHMAITPEVFVKNVVMQVTEFLAQKYGKSPIKKDATAAGWMAHLAKEKFTEYWVYWIWLIAQKQVDTYYTKSGPLLYNYVVSGEEHNLEDRMRDAFTQPGHFFSLVQTSLKHTNDDVKRVVLPYLTRPSP